MLDNLQSSDFKSCLHQDFLLYVGELALHTELIQVTELGAAAANTQRRPFSIIFRGPKNPRLPQMIYKVTHEKLGELEIFLVPVAVDEKGYQYEAVFN